MTNDIDTSNDFFFGSNGKEVMPMLPVVIKTREQAFRTAAWIQLMGETLPSEGDGSVQMGDVIEAIENT